MAVKNPKPTIPNDEETNDTDQNSVSSDDEYYDSEAGFSQSGSSSEPNDGDSSSSDEHDDGSEDGFEDQGSSDEDEHLLQEQIAEARKDDSKSNRRRSQPDDDDDASSFSSGDELAVLDDFESVPRNWSLPPPTAQKRDGSGKPLPSPTDTVNDPRISALVHTDDFSSDDEDTEGNTNRIGRVPLHWYDEYDHIGYNPHGHKVVKQSTGDGIDRALQTEEDLKHKRFVVHDALNAKDVTLTDRQVELIRRMQAGAFAHPEHDANADTIPYYSGVDPFQSGINSNRTEPKHRFQPSKYEKRAVRILLHRLEKGDINMDYLTGKIRDMNDAKRNQPPEDHHGNPFLLWKGDEEDELHNRKGPQHIAAPKQPPPTHAASYNPPDEYLPTPEEEKEWSEMDVADRPHGLLVPKKFPNLRSVGAYPHAVRERFERCLDLYLCPRVMKRRLNIDPESLVPSLPSAEDLRPFPTSRCVDYITPCDTEEKPMVRCLSVSPDGQFLVSGAEDGVVRLWEVQTGRLLRSWDVSALVPDGGAEDGVTTEGSDASAEGSDPATATSTDDAAGKPQSKPKPVVSIEWNPNPNHHCVLAAVGRTAVVIATGTGGPDEAGLTEALLFNALKCGSRGTFVKSERAAKAVRWETVLPREERTGPPPLSAFGGVQGPIVALHHNREVSTARWHRKGDYFVTVSPKAGAASVLIHQLNKANSQQPFGKNRGGEVMNASFHPSKPFLFVCGKQQIRIYHLVKQVMVKRLISGCRWISSMDIHTSGDHVIAGSLDRRMVWFDLDLSSTPYKTLKYHEKALRQVAFHPRYPLMASSSDDGCVHVFHSMVYTDLMRNPLIVPVKILKGHHAIVKKLGVLAMAFHPTQPWLFSGGADGGIRLYQDI